MTLEFGLYISIIGALFVFLALSVVFITCEILKKAFGGKILDADGSPVMEKLSLSQKKVNEETQKIAAMAAAIHTHTIPQGMQLSSQYSESAVETQAWIMAGRMEQLASAFGD